MKSLMIFFMALLLTQFNSIAQVNIIPKPNDVKITEGKFSYAKGVDVKVLRGDDATKIVYNHLLDFLNTSKITVSNKALVVVSLNLLKENNIPNDGYELKITPNSTTITSSSATGLYYGVQSLKQLISTDTLKALTCMQIVDEPAFAYRGLQLDVASNFFDVAIVKKYIDALSKLKFNQLTWKLANEQSWRIESKKYTKITEVGTANTEGFYTQEDIKQIVQYAKEHFITVIPEVDFTSTVFFDDTTFQYKKDIIDEICTLFSSDLFQISKPSYYEPEAEAYVKSKGKTIIHTDNSTSKDDIVVGIKNTKVAIAAANAGSNIIMAPHAYCSLDNYPDWDDAKLSKTMLYLPIDKVYAFNPVNKIKEEKVLKRIVGVRGNVNTKYLNTEGKLSRHIYPRIFALAECFWTKKSNKTNYKGFFTRLENIGYPGQITGKINIVKFK